MTSRCAIPVTQPLGADAYPTFLHIANGFDRFRDKKWDSGKRRASGSEAPSDELSTFARLMQLLQLCLVWLRETREPQARSETVD